MKPTNPWLHRFWLPLARIIFGAFFFIFGPLRIRNKNRIPKEGGLLILANHISDLDPPMVQFCCRRPMHFMAKSELFEMKGLGTFMRLYESFPVKRNAPDREAIRTAVQMLKAGRVVAMFPEGYLSKDGSLQEMKAGVALIIRLAGCQVICCGLQGTNKIMPYGTLLVRPAFGGLITNWGKPFSVDPTETTEHILDRVHTELVSTLAEIG